ncbi:type II toxin-antitoxin system VapC family toxin [bacterium]|nr:type II toxin-antitoxin system VapC family toxin [bacterium]
MIWIIDASVAIRWFIEEEFNANADQVLQRVVDSPEFFAVPELFGFEVFSVLCRIHPEGLRVFSEAVLPIMNSGIFRQPVSDNLIQKAGMFVELGLTGYDACYAALAMDLDGCWLTFDKKAHQKIEKKGISSFIQSAMPEHWQDNFSDKLRGISNSSGTSATDQRQR